MKSRRILAIILVIAIAFGAIGSLTVTASDEGVIWDLTDRLLTISGSGEMENYNPPTMFEGLYIFDENSDNWGVSGATSRTAPWCETVATAFSDETAVDVIINEGITSIGAYAFDGTYYQGYCDYDCWFNGGVFIPEDEFVCVHGPFYQSFYDTITIPKSVNYINEDAFVNCENLTLSVYKNSYAEQFAIEKGYDYQVIDGHKCNYIVSVTEPTCSEQGYTTYSCECGNSYISDYVEKVEHNYQNGLCIFCGKKSPNINYTISDNVLTVSGVGAIDDYTAFDFYNEDLFENSAPWYSELYNRYPQELNRSDFDFVDVIITEGITYIGAYAFDSNEYIDCFCCYMLDWLEPCNCDTISVNYRNITIPTSVTSINECAFAGYDKTLIVYKDSYAEQFAVENGYDYQVIDGHKCNYIVSVTEPTCSEQGYTTYSCECGDSYISDYVDNLGHDYAEDFTIDKEATEFEDGSKSKHCSRCDSVTEVTVIPKKSVASGFFSDNAKWVISVDGTLKIVGNGATDGYNMATAVPWYDYSETITKIEISEGITAIGNFNFYSLTNVTEIIINNPDLTFGKRVFKGGIQAVIYSKANSEVEEFANQNGITFAKLANPCIPSVPVLQECTATSVILVAVDGYEYSIDGINWQKSNVFEGLISNTTYTFYQRIAEGDYATSEISDVLTIKTLLLGAPELANRSGYSVTLKEISGYEYSLGGTVWQSSNIFGNLQVGTTYTFYQRIIGEVYSSKGLQVTTLSAPDAPQIENVTGQTVVLKLYEGYEYSCDGLVWQDSNIFENMPFNILISFYQRVAANEIDSASPLSDEIDVLLVSAPNVLVGFDILKVEPTIGYEYSIDGVYWFDENIFEVLDGECYTVYHRPKNTDGINVYENGTTTVVTNGDNVITNISAQTLVWFKKLLLLGSEINNLAADFNGDYRVDIRDLVRLKKNLAEQIEEESNSAVFNAIFENGYQIEALGSDGNLYYYLIYFGEDRNCGVTYQAMEITTDVENYDSVYNGSYYITFDAFMTEMEYSITDGKIIVSGESDSETNTFTLTLEQDGNLRVLQADNYWDSMKEFDVGSQFVKW